MIVEVFDNGWGNNYPAKQYERSIVDALLTQIARDRSRTVVINSVWYTQEFHDKVMHWCQHNDFDHIVLVAMLDPAIPGPDRYQHLRRPITALGYYPGPGHVDFWALFVDRFMTVPVQEDLLSHSDITLPFMCLNRKPHWHRKQLYERLQQHDLVDRGIVSMGGDAGTAVRVLCQDADPNDIAPNGGSEVHGIPNDIVSLGHVHNWQRCFLNVVTETVYDIDKYYFVSEKIYKPIVGCRPFLVYDPDGARTWLHSRGFETFLGDFTDISDLDLSVPGNMAPFLRTLCDQPTAYFAKKFVDLREKILYNKNQFSNHVVYNQRLIQEGISCPI